MLDHAGPAILAAGPEDRDAVLAALTAAFVPDPAVRALYPTAEEARRHFPGFAAAFAGPAFERGAVDLCADHSGAALWLPPGVEPEAEPIFAHVEATVDPARRDAVLAGVEAQGALHPAGPHWYLPFIGVRPESQGAGIGGALMRHGCARADADRLPVYLEATSRRSVPLYLRHGFEIIGIVESPGYPEIVALLRPGR